MAIDRQTGSPLIIIVIIFIVIIIVWHLGEIEQSPPVSHISTSLRKSFWLHQFGAIFERQLLAQFARTHTLTNTLMSGLKRHLNGLQ